MISLVNMTKNKSAGNSGLYTFTKQIIDEKFHFCLIFAKISFESRSSLRIIA